MRPKAIAEGDQLLAEDLQEVRRVGQLHRHADRVPEAAHVLAHRGAGADFGQFRIVARHFIRVVAAEGDQLLDDGLLLGCGFCGLVAGVH
jgi:hypothetical protein